MEAVTLILKYYFSFCLEGLG